MTRLAVDSAAIDQVILLTAVLREMEPVSWGAAIQSYSDSVHSRAFGESSSTAVSKPITRPLPEYGRDLEAFRRYLRSIDNDLTEQVKICIANVAHFREVGLPPAPYYPRRVAIILRKAQQWDLEVSFVEAWLHAFPVHAAGGDERMAERLAKARELAAKARTRTAASVRGFASDSAR